MQSPASSNIFNPMHFYYTHRTRMRTRMYVLHWIPVVCHSCALERQRKCAEHKSLKAGAVKPARTQHVNASELG